MQHKYDNATASVLEKGADYIEANGWYQGSISPNVSSDSSAASVIQYLASHPGEPVCAVGSLYTVRCDNMERYSAMIALCDYLKLDQWLGAAWWNDTLGRTKEEVIEAMRRCALEIRAGNIGDDQREYEFEPFPATEPVKEPAAPTPAPATTPEHQPA